eukprot:s4_g8.t6
MVTVDGRLVHVDFGYALGREPLDSVLIHIAVQGGRPATTIQYDELYEALGTDLLSCIFWPVVRKAFLRVRRYPGLVAEMFYTALIRERRDVRGPASRAWKDSQAFVSRNCVTAMDTLSAERFIHSLLLHCTRNERGTHLRDELKGLRLGEKTSEAVSRAWQAAMVTGRTATSGARAAAGTAADVVSAGPSLRQMQSAAKDTATDLMKGIRGLLFDAPMLPTFGETGLRSLFNGSLDVVRDEPEHRLGNLGLYVRLVGQPPNAQGPGDGRSDRFVDQRQRVRLHWRSREASDNGSSRAAWYVSSAFSPWEPTASVCETLGCEAVDWVWSGLNASILSVGLQADVGHVLFSPPRAAGQGAASHANVKCFTRDGLLGFCMRELCCRIDAVDAARFRLGFSMWELDGDGVKECGKDYFGELQEEAHLPFGPLGVVRFATPEEGLSLWEACQSPVEPQGSHSPSTRGSSREKHVFVRLLLLDTHRRSMAALHFVQMAEWDGTNGETGIGHEAVPGDRLATKSKALQALLRNLSSSSQPKVTSGGLPQALAPLIGGNCKPFLLCTVPEQPGRVFPEVCDLLDVAERASLLITAQCKRVQGLPADAFRLVDASQGLLCRTAARAPRADEGFSLREPTTAFDVPPALRGVPPPPSPQHDLSDVVRFDRPASAGASPVSDARSPSKAERILLLLWLLLLTLTLAPAPAASFAPLLCLLWLLLLLLLLLFLLLLLLFLLLPLLLLLLHLLLLLLLSCSCS